MPDLTITKESFDSLSAFHSNPNLALNWNLVFSLPIWLKVWWQNFGSGAELYIKAAKHGEEIAGIAPLQIRDDVASIIGSINVCDYQDFIVVPGMETDFYNTILNNLKEKGVERVHLEPIRPDSSIVTHLIPLAKERKYAVDYHQMDVSFEIDLPQSWDIYLDRLDGKQRHEVKRKMRNLERLFETNYRVIENKNAIPEAMNTFLKLFPEYRNDKAEFMTAEMQDFFHSLAETLAESGILKFGVLEESARKPIAMIMYFDYNDDIFLYNSAYDPDYRSKSVGIISKANCIQDSIQKKKGKFDFLKGPEQYKYYLGGKEIPLYSCDINLRQGG
jgi:CelD/BcsL family acetyltransferase involved in cellulose biosynthesis